MPNSDDAFGRFDEEVSDRLLKAVCAAYTLVTAADGRVAERETHHFRELITRPALAALDPDRAEAMLRDLADDLSRDPERGRERLLEVIRAVRENPTECRTVLGAAQVATAADGSIQPSEGAAMRDVRGALGLSGDPREP